MRRQEARSIERWNLCRGLAIFKASKTNKGGPVELSLGDDANWDSASSGPL